MQAFSEKVFKGKRNEVDLIIRQGIIKEMQSMWYKKYTSEFFANKVGAGEAEFWTIEIDRKLIGELYIFKKLDNKQFADGNNTAYLCAFRIIKSHRGMGYGTKLMKRVFERLDELGFQYATIGVEPEETVNLRLYQRLGFLEEIGTCKQDPCDVDANFSPTACRDFVLLRKTLNEETTYGI